MSDAYERERQNNSRLDELSAKVSALRGVTIDIYDNARDQGVIDSTVCFVTPFYYHTLQIPLSRHTGLGRWRSRPPSPFHFSPYPSAHPPARPEAPLLILQPTERILLLPRHLAQRLRQPADPHGSQRKQSRRAQTGWDD
jgi:hypothetical protein